MFLETTEHGDHPATPTAGGRRRHQETLLFLEDAWPTRAWRASAYAPEGVERRRRPKVMLADVVRVLPKRAYGLTRRTVRESQRWRMLEAITEVVGKRGYAEARVADVIAVAGVSRKTFYEHFRDKEHCFLTAYEVLSERLIAAMNAAAEAHPTGPARRRAQLARFVEVLVADLLVARVFMVDVLGAGERALLAREQVNARFALAVLGDRDALARRAAIVGGVNAVVVGAFVADRAPDVRRLLDALCSFIESALRE